MFRPRASLSGLVGGPSSRKTRPMSVRHPGSVCDENLLSASSTFLQKIASYSFSGVPGVGSRRSQNDLAKATRSSSVRSFFHSFSSSSVMIHLTGPFAQSLFGVLQSGGPAARVRNAAATSGVNLERRIVIITSRDSLSVRGPRGRRLYRPVGDPSNARRPEGISASSGRFHRVEAKRATPWTQGPYNAPDFRQRGIAGMRNLRMVVAYVGTRYAGWQLQPGRATIQGVLEERIGRMLHERVRLAGAGRTDAGGDARGPVANFRN